MNNNASLRKGGFSLATSAEILILPMLIMITLIYIVPTGIFFYQTIVSEGVGFFDNLTRTISSPFILKIFWNTLFISALVTVICLFLAYPLAYGLCYASGLTKIIILICIVVPYFTSIIVRTFSWMVILGQYGLINQILLSLGVVNKPILFMYNRIGVLIGMVYVLLPYLTLTIFAAMKSIDRGLLTAAYSMGASKLYAFRHVFLPLTIPGVISGSLIVFILSLAFFITPSLMGGSNDLMAAMLIQREIEINLNWSLAAVISIVLLLLTLILFYFYSKYTDLDRMMGKG